MLIAGLNVSNFAVDALNSLRFTAHVASKRLPGSDYGEHQRHQRVTTILADM